MWFMQKIDAEVTVEANKSEFDLRIILTWQIVNSDDKNYW